jgi:hypothetical protein
LNDSIIGVGIEETKYRVFLHLLTDDLIDSKNQEKDKVFELMMKELLDEKHKQKNKIHKYY